MKALSVKQPWAYLISSGEKTIELRSWQTDYRGKLLICSSKSEKDAWVLIDGEEHQLPAGVMMCVVNLVDVVKIENTEDNRKKAWVENIDEGSYGWILTEPKDVYLKSVNGKLRLFDVDDNLIEYMPDDDNWFDHSDKLAISGMKFSESSIFIKYE